MTRFAVSLCANALLGVVGTAIAEEGGAVRVSKQIAKSFQKEIVVVSKLDYLLYVPPNATKGARLPLILFLHGAGERGSDIEVVKKHGVPQVVEARDDFPFIAVSPQCPANSWWTAQAVALDALLDEVVRDNPVDTDRVYLTGLSMGGYGSWTLAAARPDRFAAVAPICGGGDPSDAPKLKDIPIWAFHGAKDEVVPLKASEEMVDAIRANGGDVRLTVYPEANHDSWTVTYDNPELYVWFLAHSLKDRRSRMN